MSFHFCVCLSLCARSLSLSSFRSLSLSLSSSPSLQSPGSSYQSQADKDGVGGPWGHSGKGRRTPPNLRRIPRPSSNPRPSSIPLFGLPTPFSKAKQGSRNPHAESIWVFGQQARRPREAREKRCVDDAISSISRPPRPPHAGLGDAHTLGAGQGHCGWGLEAHAENLIQKTSKSTVLTAFSGFLTTLSRSR